jgi:penicillin-binding protein 1A
MLLGSIAVAFLLTILWFRLPSIENLVDVQLQVPMRILTADHKVMAEFGEKRRIPLPIENIPSQLARAVIATEDRRFYEHPGVDARGLLRAVLVALKSGRKEQGASTITMQVARNFFLSREKTYARKINEILLALKIDRNLSKDTILELYLNKIYFGKNAYGVAAAAQVYYGKNVWELTLPEMAMIAGLPQAPSAINPLNNPIAAIKRRNHVLNRMHHYGFITVTDYEQAKREPLSAQYHRRRTDFSAPYVAEAVRQEMLSTFGERAYTDGYVVYTTIHSAAQRAAEKAVQQNLLAYDQRHGYRGPIDHFDFPEEGETLFEWQKALRYVPKYARLQPAVVVEVNIDTVLVMRSQGELDTIGLSDTKWARPIRRNRSLGPEPEHFEALFTVGDVIYVTEEPVRLAQLPQANAALIALDSHTGGINAMVGGYDFHHSHFNRATQAQRQPGSAFKPFVYLSALEKGYTAATLINDSPWVQSDHSLEGNWRPQNDSKNFSGPTRLRMGIVKSQNLVSIRLLDNIGLHFAKETLSRLGFASQRLPNGLSLALGTLHTSPIELAGAYSIIANGGYKVAPHLIHHIEDADGLIISATNAPYAMPEAASAVLPKTAEAVIDPRVAYIMGDFLKDAIQKGTGKRAKALNRSDIGGKTGTTNDLQDNWFAGFNRDLVCVTWLGYDDPKSVLEYGSRSALPIWVDFMKVALEGAPLAPMDRPAGLISVRIDPETGLLAHPKQKDAVFEVFTAETVPTEQAPYEAPLAGKRSGSPAKPTLF